MSDDILLAADGAVSDLESVHLLCTRRRGILGARANRWSRQLGTYYDGLPRPQVSALAEQSTGLVRQGTFSVVTNRIANSRRSSRRRAAGAEDASKE